MSRNPGRKPGFFIGSESLPRNSREFFGRFDVPESKFAFALRGQQIRYLAVEPRRPDAIKDIEFVKGPDNTAPVVMAVTLETVPKK